MWVTITEVIKKLVVLTMCHCIGDYVFQIDYIAKTKGENFYHMFVHVITYCVPFAICYGLDIKLFAIGITHFAIDVCKARYHLFNYVEDQVLHYITLIEAYILI